MHSHRPPAPCRPHPPRPAPPAGYLIQRIIACEKRSDPCLCVQWCFEGCASGSIRSVCHSGAPCHTETDGCGVRITIPLNVCLCDPCGHARTLPANAEMNADLPPSFLRGLTEPGHTLLILPCVRLLHAEASSCSCFCAKLAVSMDLYLLRYETFCGGTPPPPCPQLPLYPPPIC